MNEFELLPCPFCGNTEGFQVKTVWKTYRFVACRCKAAGPVMPDDETAVEAWNTRVESGGASMPRGTGGSAARSNPPCRS